MLSRTSAEDYPRRSQYVQQLSSRCSCKLQDNDNDSKEDDIVHLLQKSIAVRDLARLTEKAMILDSLNTGYLSFLIFHATANPNMQIKPLNNDQSMLR